MSRLFGDITQVAFVSRDLEKSMRYFIDVWGIGPWFVVRHLKMQRFAYKGRPSDADISFALANSGAMQFEIIEQHNNAPSLYLDFLARIPTGLHVQHFAVWAEDFQKTKADALARGFVVGQDGSSGVGEFCYLTHPGEPDLTFEISDRHPSKMASRAAIREIAETWDGSDPIRLGMPGR